MILFSVLMANFNNGRFLAESIQSVVNQTYTNWEIILVDDGSTDNSMQVIQEFINAGVNIKLFKHGKNLGVGATKRDCVGFSTGEIVGFLDPDDKLLEEALSTMVEAHIQNPAASLVYSKHYKGDENLKIRSLANWVKKIPEKSTNLLLDKVAHFVTFKKSAYNLTEGINGTLSSAEDKDLYYKLEEKGPVIFIDKPLYIYREHQAGVSQFANYLIAQDNHLNVIDEAVMRRKKNGFRNLSFFEYRMVRSRIFLQRGELMVKLHSSTREVFKWLFASFLQHPLLYNHLRFKYFFQSCLQ